jgi:hypothetical protein
MNEPVLLSHWCNLIEKFQYAPMEFYSIIETSVDARKVPKLSKARIKLREGGMMSAKREYLRLTRDNLIFDICGAPFGNGFFVSSRLGILPDGCLMSLPFIGPLFGALFKPETYFTIDLTMMYQQAVHNSVIEAVDSIMQANGIKPLTELERKPIFSDLLKR